MCNCTFPTYQEWLPGWLQRQKERRRRLKQMVAIAKLRALKSK